MSTKAEETKKIIEANKSHVLNMLKENKTVTNKEFLKAGVGRFSSSIMHLRDEGYVIKREVVPNSKGVVAYTLINKIEAKPRGSAKDALTAILTKKGYTEVAEKITEILDEARVTVRNKPLY